MTSVNRAEVPAPRFSSIGRGDDRLGKPSILEAWRRFGLGNLV
jgi:hypothetical protein